MAVLVVLINSPGTCSCRSCTFINNIVVVVVLLGLVLVLLSSSVVVLLVLLILLRLSNTSTCSTK